MYRASRTGFSFGKISYPSRVEHFKTLRSQRFAFWHKGKTKIPSGIFTSDVDTQDGNGMKPDPTKKKQSDY